MEGLMGIRRLVILVVAAALAVSACTGASTEDQVGTPDAASKAADDLGEFLVAGRLGAIDEAIATWRSATTIEEAGAAAETAANLVVGPNGPGYGDRDGDGVVGGDTDIGLLPDLDGTTDGLATAIATNDCVAADVLGGSWTDPGARWREMLEAIDEWRPDNNTIPSLASHPMRIVGWSTFTLESDSLSLAHEYAGHAKLHIDISRRALDC
jgi:hypothetical protein